MNPNQVTFKQVRKPRCNRKRYLVVILNGGEAVADQSEKIDPMQSQFFVRVDYNVSSAVTVISPGFGSDYRLITNH